MSRQCDRYAYFSCSDFAGDLHIRLKPTGESNKHRYVVATQSHPLRIKLRAISAVPIVHVNRSVMVLEPPSDATIKTKTLVCLCCSSSKTFWMLKHILYRLRNKHYTQPSRILRVSLSQCLSSPERRRKVPKHLIP